MQELLNRVSELETKLVAQQKVIDELSKLVLNTKKVKYESTTQTVYHTIQSLLNAKQAPTLALIASALKVDKMYVVEVLAKNSQHIRYSTKNTIEELIAIKNTKNKLFDEGKLFYINYIDYGQKKIIQLNNEAMFNTLKTKYVSHSYGETISEYIIDASDKNIQYLVDLGYVNGSDESIDWENHEFFLWKE